MGAGKTSLIKHILEDAHGFKIAVICNEVGEEKDIDFSFLKDSEVTLTMQAGTQNSGSHGGGGVVMVVLTLRHTHKHRLAPLFI